MRFMILFLVVAAAAGVYGSYIFMFFPEDEVVTLEFSEETDEVSSGLRATVKMLAQDIGPRNLPDNKSALAAAEAYLEKAVTDLGIGLSKQQVETMGHTTNNLEVLLPGSNPNAAQIVVGAHYDSWTYAPGANDNASGVAVLMHLVRKLAKRPIVRTVRLVFFTNEEPPFFKQEEMGSLHYANYLKTNSIRVREMLSLETMGYYSSAMDSQKYPFPVNKIYEPIGNFLALVGNLASRPLISKTLDGLRAATTLPVNGAAMPAAIEGVDWSDHWSFWENGYQGIMVTDTAPFRYPFYHTREDTVDKIDFKRLALAAEAISRFVDDLAMDIQ